MDILIIYQNSFILKDFWSSFSEEMAVDCNFLLWKQIALLRSLFGWSVERLSWGCYTVTAGLLMAWDVVLTFAICMKDVNHRICGVIMFVINATWLTIDLLFHRQWCSRQSSISGRYTFRLYWLGERRHVETMFRIGKSYSAHKLLLRPFFSDRRFVR